MRSAADGRRRHRMLERKGVPESPGLLRQVHDHRALIAERREQRWQQTRTRRSRNAAFPKPEFTDAEAGAREFPSSTSRSYNYFTPAKRRATVYEDVTVDVQPDPDAPPAPGLDLRLRRWDRRLPAGVDGAEVVQLARVPRSQRGVGADDLPQQRQRRAADRPEPRPTPRRRARSPAGTAAGSRSSSATSAPGPTSSTGSGCTSTCPRSATRRRT